MSFAVTVIAISTLLALSIGWAAKLSVEGEVLDVMGLAAACLALGYLAGVSP